MRRTVNIWVLIDLSACVLLGFFWYNNKLTDSLTELNAAYGDSKLRLSGLQAEQAELESTLGAVGTDSFVENQASTMYGYMMPDEIRFVISGLDMEEETTASEDAP